MSRTYRVSHLLRAPCLLWVHCLLWAAPATGLQPAENIDTLEVDPLLIEQAAEVWTILGRDDNPVWPGWDATTTPRGKDVLVNAAKMLALTAYDYLSSEELRKATEAEFSRAD